MPGPSAVLFNHQTNSYEEIPAEQVSSALASGQYTASGTSTETRSDGGLVTRPVEQLGAAATQGERGAGADIAARASATRRAQQMEAVSDKALSFSEGIVDALTIGLVHGTNEMDELRREADSGSALLGQLVGTAIGLKIPGPLSGLTKSGEALGESVARALLGEAETGFRGVVTRGLQEAGANAALMAASAFGSQITDAVLANKPFVAESIASEAGIGALIGFGAGFAGSAFGQLAKASRAAVESSGVAVKESKAALDAVTDLARTWDTTVEQHAQRLGVLRELADKGHLGEQAGEAFEAMAATEDRALKKVGLRGENAPPPPTTFGDRSAALKEAEAARDAFKELDPVRSLGGDPKEFQKWRGAVERYQTAVTDLAEKMSPRPLERARANPIQMGRPEDLVPAPHVPPDIDAAMAASGARSPMSYELDEGMKHGATPGWTHFKGATGEQLRADYERIYGHPFEETPGVHPDEGNLGGTKSPTSDVSTNAGRPAGKTPPKAIDAGASGTPQIEREILSAGDRPIGAAETGQDFVNSTNAQLPVGPEQGKKAVKDYLNSWFRDFDSKPRVSAADEMKAHLTRALDDISKVGGSRLDSAGSLALIKSLGLKEATTPLGQRLDQVWSLGQAGKFAADEARGVKTPLRKGLAGQLQRYATNKAGRAIGGALLGGSLGGPAGAIMGMALTSAGFAGKAASSAGKLMTQIATVGEALLKGRRATLAVRAVMGNRPYQYNDEGPIKDPIQRIQEIQRLAANPDAIRARVGQQLGDMAITSPEMAQHLTETAVNHITAIAQSAPAIMMTPLGKPIQPSSTALNKFYDFENAMHDLPSVLKAIGDGTASASQIKSFQVGYPAVYSELVRSVVGKVEGLDKLNEAKLKAVEKVLGYPLTRSTADPGVTARFQANWASPKPAQRPAQAFKITTSKPTPVQSASGDRAPGNERKP